MSINYPIYYFLLILLFSLNAYAKDYEDVVKRMDNDVEFGKPLVAHVVVALCDNESQGIAPVSKSLGDGESTRTNLYWGALYGVKTYFKKHENWKTIKVTQSDKEDILERIAFKRVLTRKGNEATAYVIADAWRGREIKRAIINFLEISSGREGETISIGDDGASEIIAGGYAHLTAFIGHNGLMDFNIPEHEPGNQQGLNKSSIILACYSDRYFKAKLSHANTHSLLTTNGFMAPEAYTLEAAISSWFAGETPNETHSSASGAYSKYQKAKLSWVKSLFITTD